MQKGPSIIVKFWENEKKSLLYSIKYKNQILSKAMVNDWILDSFRKILFS